MRQLPLKVLGILIIFSIEMKLLFTIVVGSVLFAVIWSSIFWKVLQHNYSLVSPCPIKLFLYIILCCVNKLGFIGRTCPQPSIVRCRTCWWRKCRKFYRLRFYFAMCDQCCPECFRRNWNICNLGKVRAETRRILGEHQGMSITWRWWSHSTVSVFYNLWNSIWFITKFIVANSGASKRNLKQLKKFSSHFWKKLQK